MRCLGSRGLNTSGVGEGVGARVGAGVGGCVGGAVARGSRAAAKGVGVGTASATGRDIARLGAAYHHRARARPNAAREASTRASRVALGREAERRTRYAPRR